VETQEVTTDGKTWDVFISHASEDKKDVAQPIADALTVREVKVWIDSRELRLGHSLRRKIDEGLAKSRFGVVILSPFFFAKRWPQRELDGLVARAEEDIILPVWHGLTEADVSKFSPTLADLIAARTSDGIDEVVRQILEVVRPGSGPNTGVYGGGLTGRAGGSASEGGRASHRDSSDEDSRPMGLMVANPAKDEALNAKQREATFEAWKLLQVALGRAADLASPLQYRPDFRGELRDETAAKKYLADIGFSDAQSARALSRSNPEDRSREFARIEDRRRYARADSDHAGFQNFVISNRLLLPAKVFDDLINASKQLKSALITLNIALDSDHVGEVENMRHEAHEKISSLTNVGMSDLHQSLRSALGISDPGA
jgi:hypothetical protein